MRTGPAGRGRGRHPDRPGSVRGVREPVQSRKWQGPGPHSLPPRPPWPALMKEACLAPRAIFLVRSLLPEAGTQPRWSCRPPLLTAPLAPSSPSLGPFLTGHAFHLSASSSGFWLSPCGSDDRGPFGSDTISVGAATQTDLGVGLVAAEASRTRAFNRVLLEEEGQPPHHCPSEPRAPTATPSLCSALP